MKSSLAMFAFLTLTLFGCLFTSVVSVDPGHAHLHHSHSPSLKSTSKHRTKCSSNPTGSISLAAATVGGSAYGTASASAGLDAANNGSSLANSLPYARTKSKCTVTKTTYINSQQTGSTSGSTLPSGQTPEGSGTSNSPAPGQGSAPPNNVAGEKNSPAASNDSAGGQPNQPASGGPNSSPANAAGACGLQSTVTITSQNTVTVTATAAATGADSGGAQPNSGSPSSYSSTAVNASAASGAGSGPQSGTNGTAASSGFIPSGTGSAYGGKNLTVLAGTGLPAKVFNNKIALKSPSPVASTSIAAAVAASSSSPTAGANNSSSGDSSGQFFAGADIGTLLRMEAIPGRTFYDFDGTTVKDPIKTLADAGVNVVRLEGKRGQCLGPTKFDNNATTRAEELLFTLDWGCLDIQVQTAQRAAALGMRLVLTINQGFDIPTELESLSYAEMVTNVQTETKRQLQPFLTAKVVPTVILLENEGSDGFLFKETSTGHVRGTSDGKASAATVDKELCGQIPTGNMVSYPQIAGYYKAEILAAQAAITAAGYSADTVRFGLHSHGQYVQWKEAVVHGPKQASQTALKPSTGSCSAPVSDIIPATILSQNASTMLTIAGFSAYPDPMTPTDINSKTSQTATLTRLTKTLTQLQGYAEAYGKFEDGPFKGQYKLQGLGVEYGTSFTAAQVAQEQALTELMWDTVKAFSAFLGILWYEPWYCYADWEGGLATLSKKVGDNGEVPTDMLKTWGAAARSPWK